MDFYTTNLTGTQILIDVAKQAGVKTFVFTSSVDGYDGDPHHKFTESHPFWGPSDAKTAGEYALSKAIADKLVLDSAMRSFRTISLPVAHLYGDEDTHAIPAALDACAGSKPLLQLGDGQNLMEIISLDSCSAGDTLAAKVLLDPSLANGDTNGEAFNVPDGQAVRFWGFFEVIWGEARGRKVKREMWVLPAALVLPLVTLMEWLYFIFTLGRLKPKGVEQLERTVVEYCLESHSYDISNIKDRFGYQPQGNWEEVLRQAVRWEMGRRGIDSAMN